MRATAKDTNDEFALFDVPDDPKLIDGANENAVAHVIILDNKAYRSSGRDAKTILTLKAKKQPLNTMVIALVAFGAVVLLLLLILLIRGGGGGGGRRKSGNAPAPVVAGGAGYGGGGGYSASPSQYGEAPGVPYTPDPAPPPDAPPVAASSGVVEITCPSCKMTTMATPGQPSVCFSCGQPIPVESVGSARPYPLTAELNQAALTPPPNPYAPPGQPTRATIVGPVGQFPILPGSEVRVGRDPQQCTVALTEPRISGVHSTLKFEASNLWVRDEQSNNGTYVGGERIAPGAWTLVPSGQALRFGPVEFDVRLES
jgi:hypothetical protein